MTGEAWDTVKEALLLLPRFVRLLGRLIRDPGVGRVEKALLLATLVYIANPFDFLPDTLPIIGQVDDLYLAALVLLRFLNRAGDERLRAAWDGPGDLAEAVRQATRIATATLPDAVKRRVDAVVEGRRS